MPPQNGFNPDSFGRVHIAWVTVRKEVSAVALRKEEPKPYLDSTSAVKSATSTLFNSSVIIDTCEL